MSQRFPLFKKIKEFGFADEILSLTLKSKLPECSNVIMLFLSILRLEVSSQNAASSGENADDVVSSGHRQVLALIIPYLNLADITALAGSCPQWQDTVDEYLKAGKFITIDGQFLEQYPVATNGELYAQFTFSTSLMLVKVPESKIVSLLACFARIKRLTLFQIIITQSDLITSLEALAMIRCQIKVESFCNWISKMKSTLKSIELISVKKHYKDLCFLDSLKIDLIPICPQLISINIQKSYFTFTISQDVISLKYFNFKTMPDGMFCSNIEYLHFDDFYLSEFTRNYFLIDYINSCTKLRSLTLRRWLPGLKLEPMRNLTYLRIKVWVDFIHKEKIEKLGIKKLEVQFSTPNPEPDLILKLNDDCLLEVFKYLTSPTRNDYSILFGDPLLHCVSLAKVHPRFDQLFVSHLFSVLHFVSDDKDLVFRNKEMFIRAAPFVKELTIDGSTESEKRMAGLTWILPHLTNLRILHLRNITIPYQAKEMPLGVERLTLESCKFEDIDAYLQRLSPTLRFLNVDRPYICHVYNIRELRIISSKDHDFVQFFQQNQHSLERLKIVRHYLPIGFWSLIGKFENLKHFEMVIHGRLSVAVHPDFHWFIQTIGPNLSSLTLDCVHPSCENLLQSKNFSKLREMTVWFETRAAVQRNFLSICSIKTLEKLTLNVSTGDNDRGEEINLIMLVESLPKLKQLQRIKRVLLYWQTFVEFVTYLKKTGRMLKIK